MAFVLDPPRRVGPEGPGATLDGAAAPGAVEGGDESHGCHVAWRTWTESRKLGSSSGKKRGVK